MICFLTDPNQSNFHQRAKSKNSPKIAAATSAQSAIWIHNGHVQKGSVENIRVEPQSRITCTHPRSCHLIGS